MTSRFTHTHFPGRTQAIFSSLANWRDHVFPARVPMARWQARRDSIAYEEISAALMEFDYDRSIDSKFEGFWG